MKILLLILIFIQLNTIIISPNLPNYTKEIKLSEDNNNRQLLKILLQYDRDMLGFKSFGNLQYKSTEYRETLNKFYDILRKELETIINLSNLSKGCRHVLEKYLLGDNNDDEDHNVSNYHIKKLIDDSSKHKDDLGSYDQCLHRKYKRKKSNKNVTFGESTYIVFTLDKSNLRDYNKQLLYKKDRTDFEDIYYVRAFCLPQEIKENYTNYHCSNKDYIEFMNTTNTDLGDLLGIRNISSFKVFNLDKFEFEKSAKEKFVVFLKSLPLILCIFHVFITLFRELIMYFVKRYYSNKTNLKNKEIKEYIKPINKNDDGDYDDDDDDDDDEEEDDKDKKEAKNPKIELPKWIKIYNVCFNFGENFKELFNFKLNSTNINNDAGLSYIRGLKGFSLFFLMLGLTYLTFMNSLSKLFSKTLFFEFLNDKVFYTLFFIGLRYSPRIIFSCSGYTLAYKFLCFINKNFNLKAVFTCIIYQIHKYLMLIAFFLFERYSLYEFYDLDSPTWKYLDINILKKPVGARYILSFFSLSSVLAIDERGSRYQQTLIDYFWLPYNEISFFIIGVIIISIGYRYKLRIDYFLLLIFSKKRKL